VHTRRRDHRRVLGAVRDRRPESRPDRRHVRGGLRIVEALALKKDDLTPAVGTIRALLGKGQALTNGRPRPERHGCRATVDRHAQELRPERRKPVVLHLGRPAAGSSVRTDGSTPPGRRGRGRQKGSSSVPTSRARPPRRRRALREPGPKLPKWRRFPARRYRVSRSETCHQPQTSVIAVVRPGSRR